MSGILILSREQWANLLIFRVSPLGSSKINEMHTFEDRNRDQFTGNSRLMRDDYYIGKITDCRILSDLFPIDCEVYHSYPPPTRKAIAKKDRKTNVFIFSTLWAVEANMLISNVFSRTIQHFL